MRCGSCTRLKSEVRWNINKDGRSCMPRVTNFFAKFDLAFLSKFGYLRKEESMVLHMYLSFCLQFCNRSLSCERRDQRFSKGSMTELVAQTDKQQFISVDADLTVCLESHGGDATAASRYCTVKLGNDKRPKQGENPPTTTHNKQT